jgi:hypothetical protein
MRPVMLMMRVLDIQGVARSEKTPSAGLLRSAQCDSTASAIE